ncbi:MAG: hypothetical protein ACKOAD_01005 [Gammaproteobacteria bacterium]
MRPRAKKHLEFVQKIHTLFLDDISQELTEDPVTVNNYPNGQARVFSATGLQGLFEATRHRSTEGTIKDPRNNSIQLNINSVIIEDATSLMQELITAAYLAIQEHPEEFIVEEQGSPKLNDEAQAIFDFVKERPGYLRAGETLIKATLNNKSTLNTYQKDIVKSHLNMIQDNFQSHYPEWQPDINPNYNDFHPDTIDDLQAAILHSFRATVPVAAARTASTPGIRHFNSMPQFRAQSSASNQNTVQNTRHQAYQQPHRQDREDFDLSESLPLFILGAVLAIPAMISEFSNNENRNNNSRNYRPF